MQAKDLQRIMDAYTIWARKIHPNMHSDDVLDRSLVLSSRLSVKVRFLHGKFEFSQQRVFCTEHHGHDAGSRGVFKSRRSI